MSEKQDTPFSEANIRKHKGYVRSYGLLADAASSGKLVTYGEIGALMGIPESGNHMSRVVGIVLGLITEEERRANRPMLSAVVVSSTNQRPGPGFYGLATQNDLLPQESTDAEKRSFWEAELQRVRDAWQD